MMNEITFVDLERTLSLPVEKVYTHFTHRKTMHVNLFFLVGMQI